MLISLTRGGGRSFVDERTLRCNNVSAMKSQAATTPKTERGKLRFGLPGSTAERKARIKAAIQASRETLRRLAR